MGDSENSGGWGRRAWGEVVCAVEGWGAFWAGVWSFLGGFDVACAGLELDSECCAGGFVCDGTEAVADDALGWLSPERGAEPGSGLRAGVDVEAG